MATIRIYQVRPGHLREYGFRCCEEVCGPEQERGLPRAVYEQVWEGLIPDEFCPEDLYLDFNSEKRRPPDFRGHSLSVSDLIEYVESGKLWFCDSIGWKRVRWEGADG